MAKAQVTTQLSPDEASTRLVPLLTGNGATVHSVSPTSITGVVAWRKGPNMLVGIILFLLIILPGVLYFIFARKTISDPFAITITAGESGTTLAASGVGKGEDAARRAINKV